MKKKVFIVLFILLLSTGCKRSEIPKEMNTKRNEIIKNTIGKTTNNRVVVKDEKGHEYYVYEIEEKSFTLYDYLFYETTEDYQQAKEKYALNTYYQYVPYEDAWGIKITLQTGVGESKEKIKKNIVSQYENDKKHEIIE